MASFIVGKFEYVKNDNMAEFYKALSVPDSMVDKMIPQPGAIREFSVDGNKIIFGGSTPLTLVLDTEVEENTTNNYKFMSTAKLEGETLVVESKSVAHPVTLYRSYNTNDKGLLITLKADKHDIVAKIYFKRV